MSPLASLTASFSRKFPETSFSDGDPGNTTRACYHGAIAFRASKKELPAARAKAATIRENLADRSVIAPLLDKTSLQNARVTVPPNHSEAPIPRTQDVLIRQEFTLTAQIAPAVPPEA